MADHAMGGALLKLRRALRADIADEAWATVNSPISRPFPRWTTLTRAQPD